MGVQNAGFWLWQLKCDFAAFTARSLLSRAGAAAGAGGGCGTAELRGPSPPHLCTCATRDHLLSVFPLTFVSIPLQKEEDLSLSSNQAKTNSSRQHLLRSHKQENPVPSPVRNACACGGLRRAYRQAGAIGTVWLRFPAHKHRF